MSKNKFYNIIARCKQSIIAITFIFFIYILTFYFRTKINLLILNYLTVEKTWSNVIIDIILLFTTLSILLFFAIKILKNKYLYSYNQFSILIIFLCFIIIFSVIDTEWEYTKFFYGFRFCFPHICIVFIILNVFLFLGIWNYFIPEKLKSTVSIFKEDNALDFSLQEADILNYTHIVKNLKKKLTIQYFNKSFTVGIVGPWGNGKSSFINLLKEEIKKDKEVISVTFLPYLNHTETEISSEFFHSFQSALHPYSGKLSNLILEYSNKLLNLYNNDKNLSNFFKTDLSSFNSISANDVYEEINEVLNKINKKIFVFVDDLDRLNQEEILQVLKLIRNTANFRNTIFIVAMDKEYILQRLNNDEAILKNRFIDKFFQLEIYLPEIEKSILIEEFKNILNNSSIFKNELVKIELEQIISLNKILFTDYVKNLRDVKRVCNQIIFEYEFVNEEIKLEDFINFILLKLNFPEFINKLRSNPLLFLEKKTNYYQLIKKTNVNDNNDFFNIDLQKLSIDELKKYKIYDQFFPENINYNNELVRLNDSEKSLLMKTLIVLFGNENHLKHNSIKFENNFRRFIQLNYKSSDFLNKNFIDLIERENFDQVKNKIDLIIKNQHQYELLDRLKYFSPDDINKLKTTIIIYLELFDTISNNKLQENEILRNFATLVHMNIYENNDGKIDVNEISTWYVEKVIKSDKFKVGTILRSVGYLWEVKKTEELWEINTIQLGEIIIQKFEIYLEEHDGNFWDVSNYDFYRFYHYVKKIDNIKQQLLVSFKAFLNKNKIDIFCAQITEYGGYDENMYKLSDAIIDFFESNKNFLNFVRTHKDNDTKEIKEYIYFLNLFDITKFSIPILFKFNEMKVFDEKVKYLKSQNGDSFYDKEDKMVQIFFKLFDESDFYYLKEVHDIDFTNYRISDFKFFSNDGEFYLVANQYYHKDTDHLLGYMEKIKKHLQKHYPEKMKINKKEHEFPKIELEDKVIVEVFCYQPF